MVIRGDPLDALADRLDDARSLVPGDYWRRRQGPGRTRQDIGVAHPGAHDTNQHFARPRFGQPHLLQVVGAIRVSKHRRGDLHRRSIPPSWARRLTATILYGTVRSWSV
jgi:hypothetical protein